MVARAISGVTGDMVARVISGVASDMVALVRCFANLFFVSKCRFCVYVVVKPGVEDNFKMDFNTKNMYEFLQVIIKQSNIVRTDIYFLNKTTRENKTIGILINRCLFNIMSIYMFPIYIYCTNIDHKLTSCGIPY